MSAIAALLNWVFALIALVGYLANGAQPHLILNPGETLSIRMCGSGGARTVELEIKGNPAEPSKDTCCGDCIGTVALPEPEPSLLTLPVTHPFRRSHQPVQSIYPRSPLWPGAPPQGPPISHKI